MNKYVRNTLIYAFLMMIILNFSHPVTPQLVTERFNDQKVFGYLFASMSLGSLMSSKIIGKIWDATQSKWMIVLPFPIGYGLSQYLMAISKTPGTMMFARFLSGPFGAGLFFVVLPAMISEFSDVFTRAQNQLYFYIVFSLASPFGYFFGGHLGHILNPISVVKIQSLLCFVMIIPGIFLLRDGLKYKASTNDYKTIRQTQDPVFEPDCSCTKLFFQHNLYNFMFTVLPALIIVTPLTKFYDATVIASGISSAKLGNLVLLNGLSATIFMVFFGRNWIKKYNEINIVLFSFILYGLLTGVVAMFSNVSALILLYPLIYGLGMFGITAVTATVAARFKTHSGEALGIAKAFSDLGFIIGPILLGNIFAKDIWLTYTVSSIFISISGLIMLLLRKWFTRELGGKHWW